MHNFSTPQHQYDHREFSSPLGGGDDDNDRDGTHVDGTQGGGVGDGSHGGGDSTHGDATHSTLMLFETPPPLAVDPPVGDGTLKKCLAVKDKRDQRLKIRSRYMSSPYTDPFEKVDKESRNLMAAYESFKKGNNDIL